ncbi:ferritin family protein [Candidatus Omnitrophota bacterium]
MSNIFSGGEIVEMGIQIEKNGRDFYNALIETSKNQKAKGIFKFLAGEEEKHIIAFQKLLDSVKGYEPPEAYPGEYFAYMSALAGDYVFTKENKGAEAAKRVKNDAEAVDAGMGFEKDSMLFYEGIKKAVPPEGIKTVDALIEQERTHFRQLSELKSSL